MLISVIFKVEKPLPHFRMIERHYFKDRLIKNFDFEFGFCMPNSANEWYLDSFDVKDVLLNFYRDLTYSVPPLSPQVEKEMIAQPYETKSDSFYFAGEDLIMHIKAEYSFDLLSPSPPYTQFTF